MKRDGFHFPEQGIAFEERQKEIVSAVALLEHRYGQGRNRTTMTLNPRATYYYFELAVLQLTAGDAKGALASVDQGADEEERAVLRPLVLDALGQRAEADREQRTAEQKYPAATHDRAIFYALRSDAWRAEPYWLNGIAPGTHPDRPVLRCRL